MKKLFFALIMLIFVSTNYACEKSEQTEENDVISGCVGYVRKLEYKENMYQWCVYPIDNQWGRLYKHEKWFAEWDEKAREQMISLIDKRLN